jgi:hypothetical protein
MKYPPTIALAFTEYTMAVISLISPWMFGFSGDSVATSCAMAFGVTLAAYSLITDYELSVRRVIPLRAHLALDAVVSGLLITSPFVMGFASTTWLPHLLLGGVVLGMALYLALYLGFAHPAQRVRVVIHPQVTAETVALKGVLRAPAAKSQSAVN